MQFQLFTLSALTYAALVSGNPALDQALKDAGAAISDAASPTGVIKNALNNAAQAGSQIASLASQATSAGGMAAAEATSAGGKIESAVSSVAAEATSNAQSAYDAAQSKYSSFSGLDSIQSGFESAYANGSAAVQTFMSTQTVLPASAAASFVQDVDSAASGVANSVKGAASPTPTPSKGSRGASFVGVTCTAALGLVAVIGMLVL